MLDARTVDGNLQCRGNALLERHEISLARGTEGRVAVLGHEATEHQAKQRRVTPGKPDVRTTRGQKPRLAIALRVLPGFRLILAKSLHALQRQGDHQV